MEPTELEEKIIDAIQSCCQTDDEKKKALVYFNQVTVNDMIVESLLD